MKNFGLFLTKTGINGEGALMDKTRTGGVSMGRGLSMVLINVSSIIEYCGVDTLKDVYTVCVQCTVHKCCVFRVRRSSVKEGRNIVHDLHVRQDTTLHDCHAAHPVVQLLIVVDDELDPFHDPDHGP